MKGWSFLGDAILGFVLGLMLYNNEEEFSEGQMSKNPCHYCVRSLIE